MSNATWSVACWTLVILLANCVRLGTASDDDDDDDDDKWNVTCPSECRCGLRRIALRQVDELLRTADCSRSQLRHVPDGVPPDTDVLLLRNNLINRLSASELRELTALQHLDLSYNDLEQLSPGPTFGNLSSLKVLDVEGNHLSTIAHHTFVGLSELDELRLSANRLTDIQWHAFSGLNELRTLYLSRNHLSAVRPEWFADLPSLRRLWLDHNQLGTIDGGSFLGLNGLVELSLSHNNLSELSADGFMGLTELGRLDLGHNRLARVPHRALAGFKRLRLLRLDDNPIRILTPGSLQSLTVDELCLRNMSSLLSLDRHSVIGMPRLRTLRVHGNRRLVYVHPEAFVDLPQLEYLLLHDNRLAALYPDVLTSLPSLRQLTLYGNPLRCDCNAFWIRTALLNSTTYAYNDTLATVAPSVERVSFPEADRFVCDDDGVVGGGGAGGASDGAAGAGAERRLVDVPVSSLPNTCKPTVLALFNDSYQEEIGETLELDCRAIGVPAPAIHWILSNGKIVRSTSNYSRIRVSKTGTLTVDSLKAEHAGTYTCVATNPAGYDTTNAVLRVHSRHIRILDRGSTNSFITVSWNGTESTIATSDYVIMYRERGTDQPYGTVHLRPYMRKYTISNLKPETDYEFCIAYRHSERTVKLNCVDIRTKSQRYMMRGIRTISKLTILLALCLTSLGVILICVLMVVVKRYQKRKSYQDPSGGAGQLAGLSPLAGLPSQHQHHPSHQHRPLDTQKVGQISNIPLDNLYNPPTTPLCTSTTSLISTQSNA